MTWEILMAVGLPSTVVGAIVGLLIRRLEKRMETESKERASQEMARREYEKFQVKMLTATTALCEANALAIQNGKCNGETRKALEYLTEIRREQRNFLTSQGIDHLF